VSADVSGAIDQVKYRAFISYSQRDKKWGDWLHKALETYRVPRRLVGKESREGKVPRRVFPIFRDREELAVSSDLGSNIEQALRESRYLIVICSPNSAQSRWVGEEIKTFKRLGREDRILALIIDGEPNASDKSGFSPEEECFPEALRYRCSEDGGLSQTKTEPIAADARKGKDGETNAKLKLLAGLLGLNYDDLKQREQRRTLQRRLIIGIMALVVLALSGSWAYQEIKRRYEQTEISTNHEALSANCASCHEKSLGPPTLAQLRLLVRSPSHHGLSLATIDRKCESCHQQHTFHEASVVQNRSCSVCHQEHQGLAPMKMVASSQCASCHNNSVIMEAAAQKGMQLPPEEFHRHSHPPQQIIFDLPRPDRGYTQTFPSFWQGHPEFQLDREQVRDPDVLRFNHQRHFATDVRLKNDKRLDCNYCHKPDCEGRFYQRVTFAANCQECHSLRFDPGLPNSDLTPGNPDSELTLPHSSGAVVHGFLRTLPTQYAEFALKNGANPENVQASVKKQLTQLRELVGSEEDFERKIFFSIDPYKPMHGADPGLRDSFYGCAFCHEVKPVANDAPMITRPSLVDRWMPQANFNHAKHASMKCDDCHHAMQSRNTSDALMPTKANCVTCHSPAGKIVAECITCHTYHAPPQTSPDKLPGLP
jgi:hypothetical protein